MQIAEILEKTGQTETMVLCEHAILTILTKLSRYHKHIMSGDNIFVEASRGGDLEAIFDEIAQYFSTAQCLDTPK